MYDFILNMWIMRRIEEENVNGYVTKGYIVQNEANIILTTARIE